MIFRKIIFQGAIDLTFRDVDIDYEAGLRGELQLKDDAFYLRGWRIPIRRNLWSSFIHEFCISRNSRSEVNVLKFYIEKDGGYLVQHYNGIKTDYIIGRFLNPLFQEHWNNPSLGESDEFDDYGK